MYQNQNPSRNELIFTNLKSTKNPQIFQPSTTPATPKIYIYDTLQ